MKKIFVSMMLAGAVLTGGTAYAQTQADGNTGATTQKECCNSEKGEKCDKGDKVKKGNKAKKQFKKVESKHFNPFDGIQLTNDQQQKLQVLQQGLGPVKLTLEDQVKIKENSNLTPEQKAQLQDERKARKTEAKKNYLQGVKETLTPDQYVVFLENCYLYAPQDQGFDKGMKNPKDSKGDKEHKKRKGDKARNDKGKKVEKK